MHASVLRYFIEVARSGSVRKASERLHVAASAVNRQILNLEEELGTELFDRLPGGMRLNPAGERLLRHAQETLHGYQVMRTELDALRGERSGHVKLAAMDSCFEDLLPAAVAEFSQLFPAATYTIVSTQPMEVPQLVASGQVDLGLSFVTRLPAGVVAVSLAHLPLGVVMPPAIRSPRKSAWRCATARAIPARARSRCSVPRCRPSTRPSGRPWSRSPPATPRPWSSAWSWLARASRPSPRSRCWTSCAAASWSGGRSRCRC